MCHMSCLCVHHMGRHAADMFDLGKDLSYAPGLRKHAANVTVEIHYQTVEIMQAYIPTAQGGGGSFKDRTPIGEVSCCESWMAERTH